MHLPIFYVMIRKRKYGYPEKTSFRISGQTKWPKGRSEVPERRLWVDGIELIPDFGHQLRPNFPNIFSWGCSFGESTAVTALTIGLFMIGDPRTAINLYPSFELYLLHGWEDNFDRQMDLSRFFNRSKPRLNLYLHSHYCPYLHVIMNEIDVYFDPNRELYTADLAYQFGKCFSLFENGVDQKRKAARKYTLGFRRWAFQNHLPSVVQHPSYTKLTSRIDEIMAEFSPYSRQCYFNEIRR
ncbi:hypothetical protein Echvi_1968 [Echinicola vietnamensis DSM 17526]|uniref:Uncharacterized protein n=2 Tax=Echinicola TaxID=390846 RepID=L0FY48_ECHVK|nr:hypothetical protein Echvi_1968 [Echinicola vietnamensis DSM 17526]